MRTPPHNLEAEQAEQEADMPPDVSMAEAVWQAVAFITEQYQARLRRERE